MQTAMKVKVKSMNGKMATRYFRTFTRSWSDGFGAFFWTGDEVDYEGVRVDRVHVVEDCCVVSVVPVVMDYKYVRFRPMTGEEAEQVDWASH